MRRLMSTISLVLLATALAGCSGGATPVATELSREAASGGGGTPPQPPPPVGCPEFFDIQLSCWMGPNQPPVVHPGHLMVNACVNPEQPTHTAIAFKLRQEAPILRIPGISVDCIGDVAGDCFAGRKEELLGNQHRGAKIVWTTKFNVQETNAGGTRVVGELDRHRLRWVTVDGERRTQEDRLHCTFTGRPGAAPPPPPPPPPPGGDGGNPGG